MNTITVWLFIAMGAGASLTPATLGQFASQADCEAVRKEAIKKMPRAFYEEFSACIRATIVVNR